MGFLYFVKYKLLSNQQVLPGVKGVKHRGNFGDFTSCNSTSI